MGTTVKQIGTLQAYLDARKKTVNITLLKLLKNSGTYSRFKNLDASLKHTVLLEGKRLRPVLALMTYELFQLKAGKNVLEAAAALELIHAGSLMLDDLPSMDNAGLRRGKKTNHVVFGDATTILASAGLWVEAFHIIGSVDPYYVPKLISSTTDCMGKGGLILGQYMDLFAFNKKQSLKDLRECYQLKTGSLFKLATTYGAVLGGASTAEQNALEAFGNAYGIAYQIRDDIIDATESEASSGKDAHKDEQNNKPNYVSLLGLEGAKKALLTEMGSARKALTKIQKDTLRFEQLVDALSLT